MLAVIGKLGSVLDGLGVALRLWPEDRTALISSSSFEVVLDWAHPRMTVEAPMGRFTGMSWTN